MGRRVEEEGQMEGRCLGVIWFDFQSTRVSPYEAWHPTFNKFTPAKPRNTDAEAICTLAAACAIIIPLLSLLTPPFSCLPLHSS
jgi:hypothetical protein